MKELLDSLQKNIEDKVNESEGWGKVLWSFLLGMYKGLYAGTVVAGALTIALGWVLILTPKPKNEVERKKEEE